MPAIRSIFPSAANQHVQAQHRSNNSKQRGKIINTVIRSSAEPPQVPHHPAHSEVWHPVTFMHPWTPRVYFPLLIILWIQRPLVISKTSDADGKLEKWDREKEKDGWEGTSSLQAHSFILRSLLSLATPALRVEKKENREFGANACLFFFLEEEGVEI